MAETVLVLGAGIVGVAVAVHLRRRGFDVALVDRQGPGEGASFGNAGLIQREAVFPAAFPRAVSELLRVAGNRAVDVSYHPLALPGFASPLLRYWWNSEPRRYEQAILGQSRLVAHALEAHFDLAREARATHLLRPVGWLNVFERNATLELAMARAERARREFGVNFTLLSQERLAALEPHLRAGQAGAIHWTDPSFVDDPHALTLAYARLFTDHGGVLATGDAETLERTGVGWRVSTSDGPVEAARTVVALGAASARVTRRFGYAPPLFGKRGYHMHYALKGDAVLNRPVVNGDIRFALTPMRRGIRLTTGVEFARQGAEPTPVQLARAEPVARGMLPLDRRLDGVPWMGVRPATPDMLPIIGPMPGEGSLWCAFGHAHQGLTNGPATGRMIAEIMTGETPFIDPAPYRPERF
ncbi:MAG: D-amino-acid dehydrogenase [Bradyrhizobium sp.]|jgi:D-amino-acid dehydrogenase|nr:D-amino-acid dehydrogenase [Bradyrhizobium sp.]